MLKIYLKKIYIYISLNLWNKGEDLQFFIIINNHNINVY